MAHGLDFSRVEQGAREDGAEEDRHQKLPEGLTIWWRLAEAIPYLRVRMCRQGWVDGKLGQFSILSIACDSASKQTMDTTSIARSSKCP
jgi:hypothetical protein